jgi:transcriptional regulator with XRE-family HTH domain
MNPQEKFGKKLKYYRTQRTYIASVENGRRNVSIQTIKKFLDALELTFSEFFQGFRRIIN